MKKIFAAVIAVILVVSALCVVSSAYSIVYEFDVGDSVVFYDANYIAVDADTQDDEELTYLSSSSKVRFISYYDMVSFNVTSEPEGIYTLTYSYENASENVYHLNFTAPGCVTVVYTDGGSDYTEKYSIRGSSGTAGSSGSFIASFLSGLTEIFAGLAKGFAGVSVNAADSLILTSDGSLTSFAQLGICGIGLALVAGVVGLLARRFRR